LNRNEGVAYVKVLTCANVIEIKMVETYLKLDVDENVEYCAVEWNNCGGSSSVLLLLLLLLLLSLDTLRRVFKLYPCNKLCQWVLLLLLHYRHFCC
jgi:hypothetical protein